MRVGVKVRGMDGGPAGKIRDLVPNVEQGLFQSRQIEQ